jgi:hypothetical protein
LNDYIELSKEHDGDIRLEITPNNNDEEYFCFTFTEREFKKFTELCHAIQIGGAECVVMETR